MYVLNWSINTAMRCSLSLIVLVEYYRGQRSTRRMSGDCLNVDDAITNNVALDVDADAIRVREERLVTPDGLYSWYWRAFKGRNTRELDREVQYKALVYVSHGLNEHMEWYSGLGSFLASKRVLAFGHDHAGYGRSNNGDKERDVDDFVADILRHVVRLRRDYAGVPCFVYGHCIGGLFALGCCLRNPTMFAGAIFESPLLVPPTRLSSVAAYYKAKLGRVLAWGGAVSNAVHNKVTSDGRVQRRWEADPLRCEAPLSYGMALKVLDFQQALPTALEDGGLYTPFLAMHGCEDELCPPRSSRFLRQRARDPTNGADVILFEGGSHHLVLESETLREQVFAETVAFIERILQ